MIELASKNNSAVDNGEKVGRTIGELLRYRGIISEQQVQQALEVQSRSNAFLGQIFVDLGFANEKIVGETLAQQLGVSYANLMTMNPEREAFTLVPEEVIRATKTMPLRLSGDVLEVATTDPLNVAALDTIHILTGKRVLPLLTMAGELQRSINSVFDVSSRTSEAISDLESESNAEVKTKQVRVESLVNNDAPVVRLVDSIIESGMAMRASDIHFEPQERALRVRYRVDGVLVDHAEIPRRQMSSVIARLKVLCLMDITESRRPQDGRMRHDDRGRSYDIRVSSVPTVNGEKLVLRILDKSAVLVPLAKLGLLPKQQQQLESLIYRPHGMALIVGPTGSGKSTTLYSALNLLNDSQRNIMTLEDPVEYNVPGLNQVQVNSRRDLTFASGLRAFVRQDPDVILVGEIRDEETAQMAVQASLTGHLLLSTLHTNSALGTVARLKNLGVDQFLIAQALSGVVSQRLVAKVCNNCIMDYKPEPEILKAVGIDKEDAATISFKKGKGCRSCLGRGYLGRFGVYEILVFDEEIRRMVLRGANEYEMSLVAQERGMIPLRDSALTAVRAGLTTPEELGRVALAKEG